jgi:hypothetical protein
VFPSAVTVLGWGALSWLIVGEPFEQFTSAYGNSAQVASVGTEGYPLSVVVEHLAVLAPLLPLVLVVAAAIALWRRDPRPLAPLAVFVPPLVFHVLASVGGYTLGWLRFYVLAVPLLASLCAYVAGRRLRAGSPDVERVWSPMRALATTVAIVSLVVSGGITAVSLRDGADLVSEEYQMVKGFANRENFFSLSRHRAEREVARYLDDLDLKDGSVVVDTWLGWRIVVLSERPEQFVVSSDRDFPAVTADPASSGVAYLLVPQGGFLPALDALNRAYPELYENGAHFAPLEREFDFRGGQFEWRLYRVTTESSGDGFLGSFPYRAVVVDDRGR